MSIYDNLYNNFLRLIPRNILKIPAVIRAKAVIYTMLRLANKGFAKSKKENNRVTMLQKRSQPHCGIPAAFNWKDRPMDNMLWNSNQKPTYKGKMAMVIKGWAKSNMPMTRSRIPPAKYQPQSFISFLLEMENMIWNIPDTKMNTLKIIICRWKDLQFL